ncbi:MAG: hypothetical protein N3A57_01770 [Negativicutes bacterium]|nr:hypothetical protein [Negativicutes bacterium]
MRKIVLAAFVAALLGLSSLAMAAAPPCCYDGSPCCGQGSYCCPGGVGNGGGK